MLLSYYLISFHMVVFLVQSQLELMLLGLIWVPQTLVFQLWKERYGFVTVPASWMCASHFYKLVHAGWCLSYVGKAFYLLLWLGRFLGKRLDPFILVKDIKCCTLLSIILRNCIRVLTTCLLRASVCAIHLSSVYFSRPQRWLRMLKVLEQHHLL